MRYLTIALSVLAVGCVLAVGFFVFPGTLGRMQGTWSVVDPLNYHDAPLQIEVNGNQLRVWRYTDWSFSDSKFEVHPGRVVSVSGSEVTAREYEDDSEIQFSTIKLYFRDDALVCDYEIADCPHERRFVRGEVDKSVVLAAAEKRRQRRGVVSDSFGPNPVMAGD